MNKLGQDKLPGMVGNFTYLKGGENTFMPEKGQGKPGTIGLHCIGGLIKHVGALTALGSSTVNSYRRLWDTGFWAPVYADWGYQNRTCALRISAPGRFEYRSVDSTVNPYLMAAAILKSFDDGIRNKMDPGEPEERNIYAAMAAGKKVKKLPMSLGDALTELDKDEIVKSATARRDVSRLHPLQARRVGKIHVDGHRMGPAAVLGLSALIAGKEHRTMCGIAGLIHRGKTGDIGQEMTAMLQSLKHRGPDSTGYALYGKPHGKELVLRFKVAEQDEMAKGFDIHHQVRERRAQVDKRLAEMGAKIIDQDEATEYAYRYRIEYDGDRRKLADYIEDIDGAEILSLGLGLELIKDLGDAARVASQYKLPGFIGTHAIGHTRMATESDVDIRSAHPYWAYPFADVSVVHNGQLTNYWNGRRALERRGHRFMSNCDSELIAVYLADKMEQGATLKDAMKDSIEQLDGVFTYLVATADSLGMAKDVMAAKPMVLYESDKFIALASEEVAIRSVFPHEIDTFDPYEGEVRVWHS